MSRSHKKAFYTISKRMAENVHSVARRIVKTRLKQIDPYEGDDIGLVDCDVKELGLEDWGTKLGLEFDCDSEWKGERERARRK